MNELNLKALFLGGHGENVDFFKETLLKLIDEHVGWRQNYQPQDMPIITPQDKRSESFQGTLDRTRNVLSEVSTRLRANSVPWHSLRYWGHMNSETLLPSIMAYTYAMLWNGNNVAYESSPGTSQMEEEVGLDFTKLMSYKQGQSWGHICADGTVANTEGLWYARNIKSIPFAIKEVAPELVAGKSEWELLNMSVKEILDLMGQIPEKIEDIKAHSARSGKHIEKLGKWIIPQTKHYSWVKAADIVGIGHDNVEEIDIDKNYRMDIDKLEAKIREFAEKRIPILGVVGVVGTTEEGQVDRIDKIIELRDKFAKEGIHFYVHVDSAYGSYARSIFLDEDYNFIDYDKIDEYFDKYEVFTEKNEWLTEDIYNSFKAMSEADSITIDPHKMGYIPYSAGGIAIKDIRMRDVISYFATYVFEKGADIPALLGAYMLEGSKAGATAAAVWTAHRVLPLNITGYGKLIGASIEGAYRFYNFMNNKEFKVGDKTVVCHTLTKPDFNMVDYVFNEEGNTNLVEMNEFNKQFYDYASFSKGGLYNNKFLTSHTDFAVPDYGHSPFPFVQSLGFSRAEWDVAQKVTILRACALSPYARDKKVFDEYAQKIEQAIQEKLEAIYSDKQEEEIYKKLFKEINQEEKELVLN
ncbi:tyrosine decarboxylase [Ectobacillus polymachus]|uniref:tyrosine decarboxylase n=1 Tax=Ectobacillus polymachus TaxID=1508806 RepID=UPI003A892485